MPTLKFLRAGSIDPCIANDRGRSPVPRRNPPDPRIDYAKINNLSLDSPRRSDYNVVFVGHPHGVLGFVLAVVAVQPSGVGASGPEDGKIW